MDLALEIIFIFIFGLVLGSFVNALQYRIGNSLGINGRSFCPKCKHWLAWYDLVPVFSWLFLRGKCRSCKKPISPQYPLIEILSGFSLLALTYFFGIFSLLGRLQALDSMVTFRLIYIFVLCSILSTTLILLALHDYKTGYVLSYYTYFAIAAALALVAFGSGSFIGVNLMLLYLYSAIGAAAPFAFIWAVSRGKWMGAGDIELAFLVGILLGWPLTIIGLYFAFVSGSLIGLLLIGLKRAKGRTAISFAPFLISGIYFALLFGQQLVSLYVRILVG